MPSDVTTRIAHLPVTPITPAATRLVTLGVTIFRARVLAYQGVSEPVQCPAHTRGERDRMPAHRPACRREAGRA